MIPPTQLIGVKVVVDERLNEPTANEPAMCPKMLKPPPMIHAPLTPSLGPIPQKSLFATAVTVLFEYVANPTAS